MQDILSALQAGCEEGIKVNSSQALGSTLLDFRSSMLTLFNR